MQLYYSLTANKTFTAESVQQGQNVIVCDCSLSGGDFTITLPQITDLLYGTLDGATNGAGGMYWTLRGTITAVGANSTLTLNPNREEGDSDEICGDATVRLQGLDKCFEVNICGRHQWILKVCDPATQS